MIRYLSHIADVIKGKAPLGSLRSKDWPKARKLCLIRQPECMACASIKNLEVHHIFPFHLDPSKELDQDNLITLCRGCHCLFGHLGSWKSWNETVSADAAVMFKKVEARP